jgi:hypothetical protein
MIFSDYSEIYIKISFTDFISLIISETIFLIID